MAVHANCKTDPWADNAVPYICWDRQWTVADIRGRLRAAKDAERHRLMAWLMRELKTTEVWNFLTPGDIQREFEGIRPWLGPARPLWEHLLGMWHEMGRV